MVAKQATLFPNCSINLSPLSWSFIAMFSFFSHSLSIRIFAKMTPTTLERISKLIAKYHIDFGGPVEQKSWPAPYAKMFDDVQRLGKKTFQDYSESSIIESLQMPWKETTKRHAERVVALAKRCRDESRNEAGWRMTLESEVMARFTIEVAW